MGLYKIQSLWVPNRWRRPSILFGHILLNSTVSPNGTARIAKTASLQHSVRTVRASGISLATSGSDLQLHLSQTEDTNLPIVRAQYLLTEELPMWATMPHGSFEGSHAV